MQRSVVAFLGILVFVAVASIYAGVRLVPPGGTQLPSALDVAMHDYLLRHPDVVIESIARMQAEKQQAQLSTDAMQRAAVVANRAQIFNDPTSQSAGNPNGDVTLVLFFDYRCPYCKQGVGEERALLKTDPGVRVVYKEFPILGAVSMTASRAALASVRQGKYLPFHDAMMGYQGAFTDLEVFAIAQSVGIDVERLKADMSSTDITAILRANFALAQELGINGTPAYVIGNRLVGGLTTADDFKKLVAEARAGGAMARP
jgi:protein-disulfide isomerase